MINYVALGDDILKQILQIRPLEALSLLLEVVHHASDAGCRYAIPNAWIAAVILLLAEECTVTLLNQEGGNYFPLLDDCH